MQGDSAQINAATIIPIIATIVSLLLPPSPAQAVNRPSLHQTVPIDEDDDEDIDDDDDDDDGDSGDDGDEDAYETRISKN